MKIFIITLLTMFNSCGAPVEADERPEEMICQIMSAWGFSRCENDEAICYVRGTDGISCQFK